MINEYGAFTFPSNVKTRDNMVHFGNRNTRNHVNIKLIYVDILQFFFFRWHASCDLNATFCMGSFDVISQ